MSECRADQREQLDIAAAIFRLLREKRRHFRRLARCPVDQGLLLVGGDFESGATIKAGSFGTVIIKGHNDGTLVDKP